MTTVVEHVYAPRGSAQLVLDAREPEVLVSGPAGTGKSMACLWKLLIYALNTPGFKGLIIRKTQVSIAGSAAATWEEKVAKPLIDARKIRYFGGSPRKPPSYNFKNGSMIALAGMDKPSRIMSTDWDIAYVQEATELTIADWEAITSRLRGWNVSVQQIIADCNPDMPTHWLLERCNNGTTRMIESRHEDNPALFDDAGTITPDGAAYLAKLDALTGVRKQRLRYGRWVAAEGIIYEEFDPAVHLTTRREAPLGADWTRWWSIDWGFTNPCVLQWWAEDPDGRLILYREIYHTKLLVEDLALQALLQVTKVVGKVPERDTLTAKDVRDDVLAGVRIWTEPKPRAIVCDHDSGDRATFEKHAGMSTTKARKSGVKAGLSVKTLGIQAVQARFKAAGDGRVRVQLCRDAVVRRDPDLVDRKLPASTVEELPGYVWAVGADGRSKEEPRDEDNHGMDAARYLVGYRDLRGRTGVRWL